MEHRQEVPERSLDKMRQVAPEQLLQELRQGKLKGREVYRAVQVFGEKNYQAARPEVEALLHSEDCELRFVALKVLTRYWRLMEHWETARQVLLHDPEEECRFRAAHDLGSLAMNTGDVRTLEVLAPVVCNEQEDDVVRRAAYAAMLAVFHFDPREQMDIAVHGVNFKTEVDWEMVKRYAKKKDQD